MKFADYQNALLNYIGSLNEEGEDALDFFNNLMFVEGDFYGSYQCDICGHPLKYAMVIKALYIERVCITAHPDNDVFIGTTCFKKLSSLAWMEKNLNEKYKEWQTAIKELRAGDDKAYKNIMISVKEVKAKLKEQQEAKRNEELKSFYEKRKTNHETLLKNDEQYSYLFEKYGYKSKDETDDEGRRFYSKPFASIEHDNDFLIDLFHNIQSKPLSDKQSYWFDKLIEEDKFKGTPEYKEQVEKHNIIKEQLLSLCRCRLSSFDEEFVRSLSEQAEKGRFLSEKQKIAVDNFTHKYRKQLTSFKLEK